MKKVSLSGSPREGVGKKDAARLRSEGQVPCVVYGSGSQTHFSVNEVQLEKMINTSNVYLFELDIDGKKTQAIIQDLQFHPVTDRVIHVDFLEATPGKELKISLPVILNGTPLGVRNGGRLSFPARSLAIKGVPADLPDAIEVEVDKIRIGQSIRVADLDYPGLKFLAREDSVIMGVRMARGAVDTDEESEEGAEAAEGGEAAEAPAEGGGE